MDDPKIAEFLAAFEPYDGLYKRHYVDAAIARKEEISPHLIAVLEQVLANPAKYVFDRDYFAHMYAFILLGHFKEPPAHKVIVDLFSLPEIYIDPLFGDSITEDLSMVLFRTCDGSLDLIKELVLNKEAYEYCRSAAISALAYAVVEGMVPREEILDFFGSLFTGTEAEPGDVFWSSLASSIYDLYPAELMPVIEEAYRNELIEPVYIGLESFEQILAGTQEQALEGLRRRMRYRSLDDIHNYISWWAIFEAEEEAPPSPASTPVRTPLTAQLIKRSKYQKKAKKKRKRKIARASRKKSRRRR